jgi:glutamine amidotransferase
MIAIINGCGTNIASLEFSLKRLGKKFILTHDVEVIKSASHIILPGVGTAHTAMRNLERLKLIETIRNYTKPILGICLGMQILYEFSYEGEVNCLQIMRGKVNPLQALKNISIPHMGWNTLDITKSSFPLFDGIKNKPEVYFIHEFAAAINEFTTAECEHGIRFCAASQYNNFYGVQFHPEKSGKIGEKMLNNFLEVTL